MYFVEIEDSSGSIKTEILRELVGFEIRKEQSVHCRGILSEDRVGKPIIIVKEIILIGDVSFTLSPSARANFDVFSPQNAQNVVSNKHLYIRNCKNRDILIARDLVIEGLGLRKMDIMM